ncbi:MAG: efflux RND transporter periplasmic adaptor subunit [Phycisphaeraceae bacterium]
MSKKGLSSVARSILYYGGSALVCLLLAAAAAGGLYWIYGTEPQAEREGATRKSAALVDTIVVTRGTHRPELVVLGNVQPEDEIQLSALVGGEIIAVDPSFEPGGIVEPGQPLLTIDPADYRNVVTLRESELKQIEAELSIERGRQDVARKELASLGRTIDPENRALVLREPQIASLEARIQAARAALDQARLDLQRTQLNAPFRAQIMERTANLGTRIAAGDPVARLVGVDTYWVYASVPVRHLSRIDFADDSPQGSKAKLTLESVWGPDASRTGEVRRLIGELDPRARLAQVLVAVDDPLALGPDQPGPRLLLDTIVRIGIQGRPLEEVVRLPREVLRQNSSVWIYDDGKLAIRTVQIAFGNDAHVYISDGLEDNDEVVTTALATVTEGRPLRRIADETADQTAEVSAGSDE